MCGTCLNCPLLDSGTQWKFNYTFFEDVVNIREIVDLIIQIHELARKIVDEAKAFVVQ